MYANVLAGVRWARARFLSFTGFAQKGSKRFKKMQKDSTTLKKALGKDIRACPVLPVRSRRLFEPASVPPVRSKRLFELMFKITI